MGSPLDKISKELADKAKALKSDFNQFVEGEVADLKRRYDKVKEEVVSERPIEQSQASLPGRLNLTYPKAAETPISPQDRPGPPVVGKKAKDIKAENDALIDAKFKGMPDSPEKRQAIAEERKLLQSIQTAMRTAQRTAYQASNRKGDYDESGGWSLQQEFTGKRDSTVDARTKELSSAPYRKELVQELDALNRKTSSSRLLPTSLADQKALDKKRAAFAVPQGIALSEKTRKANCGERADIVSDHLWKTADKSGIKSIEKLNANEFDHAFNGVNLERDPNRPNQFTNGYIVDSRFSNEDGSEGKIVPATQLDEFLRESKEKTLANQREMTQASLRDRKENIGFGGQTYPDQGALSSAYRIEPHKDKYPLGQAEEAEKERIRSQKEQEQLDSVRKSSSLTSTPTPTPQQAQYDIKSEHQGDWRKAKELGHEGPPPAHMIADDADLVSDIQQSDALAALEDAVSHLPRPEPSYQAKKTDELAEKEQMDALYEAEAKSREVDEELTEQKLAEDKDIAARFENIEQDENERIDDDIVAYEEETEELQEETYEQQQTQRR